MYTIYKGDHEIVLSNSALNPADFHIVYNRPSRRMILHLVLMLENFNRKPRRIWLNGDPEKLWAKFQELFKIIKAGGGAVFNPDGNLLLIQRMGYWDLPKGKWQKGESIETCAIREVEEECNVFGLTIRGTLTPTYHLYFYRGQWSVKESIWFIMECREWQMAKPQLEEEITEIRWMPLTQINIDNLHTYPGIRNLLHELLARKAGNS